MKAATPSRERAPSAETGGKGERREAPRPDAAGPLALALATEGARSRASATPPPPPPPPSSPVVRRACVRCGEDEEVRRFPAGPVVRRCAACERAAAEGRRPPEDCPCGLGRRLRAVLEAVSSGGAPLDATTRAYFEPRLGRDLSDVRVHTGSRADASARGIDALAYAVGANVAFRDGAYAPGTATGRRLLAHELAHVVQSDGGRRGGAERPAAYGGGLALGRMDDPAEREAEAVAGAVSAGEPAPAARTGPGVGTNEGAGVVRRQPPTATPPAAQQAPASGLPQGDRERLAERGLSLSPEDEAALAAALPDGVSLWEETVYVLATSPGTAEIYRLEGFRAQPPPPLAAGGSALIFQMPSKGRSILIVERSGGSVMLDVGSGQRLPTRTTDPATGARNWVDSPAARELVEAAGRVFGSGLAGDLREIRISHRDADHLNALRLMMEQAFASRTTVSIAEEQIRTAAARGTWNRVTATLQPAQQVVEIDVTGPGGAGARRGPAGGEVHVRRTVLGGLELIEFRSVEAHRGEAAGRSGLRNRTSPVTVVIDHVTGTRQLFTADAEGRQFTEIVDAIGERAFQRILGVEGGNVRLMEIPHHGGRVAGGPNVRGMIRMLQLAFEGSNGSVRLITQTSESFSGSASASVRLLDVAGVTTERITTDPSPAGRSEVVRAEGGRVERVQVDAGAIRSVLNAARAHETEIMSAYARLGEITEMQRQARVVEENLARGGGGGSEVASSAGRIRAQMETAERELRQRVNAVWGALEAAAGAEGMRASQDTSQVRARAGDLRRHMETLDLTRARNGLEMHRAGLNLYGRLFVNAAEMLQALRSERYPELNRLRAEHRELLQRARGALGAAEVDAHVRGAWETIRSYWTGERIRELTRRHGTSLRAQRSMMTEFRVELGERLERQMRLNELVERASHGGRTYYRPDGTVGMRMRTRAGAGFLAALEIFRIGFETYGQIREASEAAEQARVRARLEGTRTALWWVERGVAPTLALVARDWWSGRYENVDGGRSQSEIRRIAASGEESEEYEMVVVEDAPDDDLLALAQTMFATSADLEEWEELNESNPSGPAFRRFPGGIWGVRLWSRGEGRYLYKERPALREPLERMRDQLRVDQEASLAAMVEEHGGEVRTVEDTALIFGTDRLVYVFNRYGNLKEIDFDDVQPRFVVVNRYYPERWNRRDWTLVRAADLRTYDRLRDHYWKTRGQEYLGAHGGGYYWHVSHNRRGYALVDPDDLETVRRTPGGGAARRDGLRSVAGLVASDAGAPLDAATRAYFEPRLGRDLSGVRVHTGPRADASARDVGALAYAVGRNVAFRDGAYAPGTANGRRLLAHELAHVVQNDAAGGGTGRPAAYGGAPALGRTDDPAEREAESVAERIASGDGVELAGSRTTQPATIRRTPDGEEERLPEPFNVTWAGDRFRVRFEREERPLGDVRLTVELRYLGSHRTDGPGVDDGVKRMSVGIAPRTLRAELRPGAAQEVVLDLYGDRVHTLRLRDDVEHDPRSFSFGRRHGLTLLLNGETRHAGSLWVLDPASTEAETRRFEPGFLPGTVPEFDGAVNPATGKLELKARLDGDGDGFPELEATVEAESFMSWASQMRAREPIRVFLRQANDPTGTRRYADFTVRAPGGASPASGADVGPSPHLPAGAARLAVDVARLTDGRAPTVIDLTAPPSSEKLEIHPPEATDGGIGYIVEKGGRRIRYSFPPEPAPLRYAVEAGAGQVAGHVAFWDVGVGPYGDRFRVMVDTGTAGRTILGVAPLGGGVPYAGSAVPISFSGSPYAIRLLESGPVHLALDFDGDGRADLRLHDRLQAPPGVSPEAERTHELRLSGPAVGSDRTLVFQATPGWIRRPSGTATTADDRRARAAAQATHALLASREAGSFAQRRLAFESAFLPYRKRALDDGWITRRTYDAWNAAELEMIAVEAQVSAGTVQAALRDRAADAVLELERALSAETRSEREVVSAGPGSATTRNPYTRETHTVLGTLPPTTAPGRGGDAAAHLRAGRWGHGLAMYRELRDGLDRWIVERARRAGTASGDLARLRASAAMTRQLEALAAKDPLRVHAVFRPDPKFRGEAGYQEQVPLEMYAWKEDGEWRLVDLTNPLRPRRLSASAGATDFASVTGLMAKLDDEDLFCEGRIFYDVPGIATGQVRVLDRVTWRDFFTWLGIGLAVVGTVLSFGTGAVAVAGTWALVGSAVAGGTAAAINLVESIRHGTATGTSIVLDLTQVVASVAGVGALAAGRILSVARSSAAASRPLTGARWATLAGMAQRYVIPLAGANLAADAVTLAVLSADAARQMDAIENGPGTSEAKRRAKLRLLSQLALTGGLTALSLRGNAAEIRMGRSIEVVNVGGQPVVVPVGTSVAGRAVTETAGRITAATDDAARALAEQAHLRTIRQRIEGPAGRALADVEELALGARAGRPDATLTVGAAGTLTRGGAAAGTLDELTERVARANNASRAHGIDVEYVLEVRSGGAAGAHEVRVARRARAPGAGGDPRRLYVDVAGRSAAEARELGRLRAAAGSAPLRIELSPDGLLRVNGQIDLHPSRLAEIPDADLAALSRATQALDAAGGDMTVLARTDPTAHSRLEKFASSSDRPHPSGHPARGYRLRFAHSHRAGLELVDDLLARVGTSRAQEPAFRNPTARDLDRLYDLTTESMPSGTTHAREQATRYALDQNPASASEFVNHYQFYVAELKLRAQTEIETRVAAGQAVGRGTKRQIYRDVEAAMADATNPSLPSRTTSTAVRAQYDRIQAQVAGRIGASRIDPGLDDAAAVRAVRALPHVRFAGESAAVYHTHKHYGELPSSRRPAGTPEFDAYSDAARATIRNPAQSAADVAATRSASQRGGARSFTFTLSEGGREMKAIVVVTDDGAVFLATLIPL